MYSRKLDKTPHNEALKPPTATRYKQNCISIVKILDFYIQNIASYKSSNTLSAVLIKTRNNVKVAKN